MSGRTFGYARVAAPEGELGLARQRALVESAGADQALIFEDVAPTSVGVDIRPGLANLFAHLGEGDEVIVWHIDRIARHPAGLRDVLDVLGSRGATLRTPEGPVDPEHARFTAGLWKAEREAAETRRAELANRRIARASETPESGAPDRPGGDPA